ncbi:putative High choriolytic enzyme 2 [Hypsibius exemplaris]|uniref:Metalloendopeptidase n=1 Tax=Hypsibius exemplaris TaxID=2072580 RepID=A0A9X6NJT2_HYPEX|nr:putative High choriolytic enzyme 2 [Hypsibius exemplaris]
MESSSLFLITQAIVIFALDVVPFSAAISSRNFTEVEVVLTSFRNSTHSEETVVEKTEVANNTWAVQSHAEVIYSTDNKLIVVTDDQLPQEYWVPVKPKLAYWPNKTVAVEIDKMFTYAEQRVVWIALEAMSESVGRCVQFVRRSCNEKDYLYFKKAKTCDSAIGYKGGRHIVKLSTGCLDPEELGAIQHEVLHALGFFHEHSRDDRDDWVEINWENVLPRDKRDFKKLKFRTFNLPYDYTSLMHYPSDAYAIDEKVPTLLPTKPAVNITTMGQRIGLSLIDVRRFRVPYQCDDLRPSQSSSFGRNRDMYQKSLSDDEDASSPSKT